MYNAGSWWESQQQRAGVVITARALEIGSGKQAVPCYVEKRKNENVKKGPTGTEQADS